MQHDARYMTIGSKVATAVPPKAMASLVRWTRMTAITILTEGLVVNRVNVSCSSRREEHLDANHDEDGRHGYQARHSRVALVPEGGQTWVRERFEGGRQEVDEGGRDQDTSAKVPGEEQKLVGDRDLREALDDDGEATGWSKSALRICPRSPPNIPAVLRVSMSSSANTCNAVLYSPRPPLVPHAGRSGPSCCLRCSSARSNSVGMSEYKKPRWRIPVSSCAHVRHYQLQIYRLRLACEAAAICHGGSCEKTRTTRWNGGPRRRRRIGAALFHSLVPAKIHHDFTRFAGS